MAAVLIVGADEDLETAGRLARAGHAVWLAGPEPATTTATGARFLQLDVTSDESLTAAAAELGSLDVLVNNVPEQTLSAEAVRETFEADLAGLVRVLHAFLPLLERSAAPVVVNVSSRSDALATAAVNVVTVQYAKAFPQLRFNAVEREDAEAVVRIAGSAPGTPRDL